MKALFIDNVSKNFGGFQVLKNITIDLEEGVRLVIIGPNGAGKTTLLNLINGIIEPFTGRIFLFEREVTRLPTYKRARIGLSRTFQILSLFPNLTVGENLLLSLISSKSKQLSFLRPVNNIRYFSESSQKLLEEVGLWGKKDMLVSNLSHGEQKRVEFAMSLAQTPRLLLLDEPTAGLSIEEAGLMSSMIRSLPPSVSTVIIEHHIDIALELANHVVVLNQGMIFAEGSPEEIRGNPKVQEVYLGKEEYKD